jgi:hypothetical protein
MRTWHHAGYFAEHARHIINHVKDALQMIRFKSGKANGDVKSEHVVMIRKRLITAFIVASFPVMLLAKNY